MKYLLTALVLIATAVALFGVLQYFLPSDLLSHVGYTLERGVKPLFFIDDKPDLPRVMSTLKDPNSLGAYLILPILITGYAMASKSVSEKLFVRPFRREVMVLMLGSMLLALFLTFSRGALIGLLLSIITILIIVTGDKLVSYIKKYWIVLAVIIGIIGFSGYAARNTYLAQNVIFHADESTVLEDPNEKRVTLFEDSVDAVIAEPV